MLFFILERKVWNQFRQGRAITSANIFVESVHEKQKDRGFFQQCFFNSSDFRWLSCTCSQQEYQFSILSKTLIHLLPPTTVADASQKRENIFYYNNNNSARKSTKNCVAKYKLKKTCRDSNPRSSVPVPETMTTIPAQGKL
jgi:hypothetical protein